jgi:hypothetical protein
VSLRVSISDPRLLPNLAQSFVRGGCQVSMVSGRVLEVRHIQAHDAQESRMEVWFFLRSWQLAHPAVDVALD